MPRPTPFPDLKGQAPLRHLIFPSSERVAPLFLTSKVRLHCDVVTGGTPRSGWSGLFLTSKVRLHCDGIPGSLTLGIELFLTSKVRLHCDQALAVAAGKQRALFLTSKVRLHCDPGRGRTVAAPWSRFS